MGTVNRRAIALRMLAAVALTPTTAMWAAPDPGMKLRVLPPGWPI
jgi:hypothetical protein